MVGSDYKQVSHYKCLKCEEVLEKSGQNGFCRSDEERSFVADTCKYLGIDSTQPMPVCKDCDLVYPYVYHSPDLMREKEPFGCASCGYFLETLGTTEQFSILQKIFYCPDCMRRGLLSCLYGFVDAPNTSNKYFLPLTKPQIIERFAFLESSDESAVDLAYYSEAFSQDPDYVINRLGNQDCCNFIQILKFAYDYEPPIVEDPAVTDDETIEGDDDDSDVKNELSVPPCPDHNIYEEFVLDPNSLFLKSKADKSAVLKNITTFSFLFIVFLMFMFTAKGDGADGGYAMGKVAYDIFAMGAFVSLAILLMSLAVNYFNLYYFIEVSCENGTLTISINDKVQSDTWLFNNVKSICLAQYSKKKKKSFTVDLDAPISTSKKSHSGVKTIGLFIYQHKKRYLIKLPFSHSQIKWLGIVIREVCKFQGIIKQVSSKSSKKSSNNEKTSDATNRKTTPKDEAIAQLHSLVSSASRHKK